MEMNRILFLLIFVAIGALSYGWWYNRAAINDREAEKLKVFVNAGPRFTGYDGQELCEALREVAKHSIGFQQSGKPMPECNYVTRNK